MAKLQYQDDDELHVLLTADSDEALESAEKLVREILVPKDDHSNRLKTGQLELLAILNGTLQKRGEWDVSTRTWESANVKCGICGEVSHPEKDCPVKSSAADARLDEEYEAFLVDIGEKVEPAHDVEKSYLAFKSELENCMSNPVERTPHTNRCLASGEPLSPRRWMQMRANQQPVLANMGFPNVNYAGFPGAPMQPNFPPVYRYY